MAVRADNYVFLEFFSFSNTSKQREVKNAYIHYSYQICYRNSVKVQLFHIYFADDNVATT